MRTILVFAFLWMITTFARAESYQYFEDAQADLNLPAIAALDDASWHAIDNPNFGSSRSTFWIRFKLDQSRAANQLWFLSIKDTYLDHAILFSPDGSQLDFGEMVPISQHPYPYIYPVVPINAVNLEQYYYLKLYSSEPIRPLIAISSEAELLTTVAANNLFYGAFYGIMLAFLVYNLFILLIVRNREYYYYLLFLGSFIYLDFSMSGYGSWLLFPENPYANHRMIGCFLALSALTATVFARDFLAITKKDRLFYYAFQSFIGISLAWLVMVIVITDDHLISLSSQAIFSILPILLFSGAVYASIKRHPQAKYFLIAWTFFLLSVLIRVLIVGGVIENTEQNFFLVQLGVIVLVVFLSLALAARIKKLQQEKREVAQRANVQLQIMNDKLAKSNHLKDLFLTNLSHELRTPINGAKGMLQILRQQADHAKLEQYDLAIRSTSHIQMIIEKLLILAESQDHQVSFNHHWFDLQDVLQTIKVNYTNEAADNHCELFINDLEQQNVQYYSTYEALVLIFSELVENAIKFSAGQQVELTVTTTPEGDRHRIELCVHDTGIGMSENTIANIYSPFWQDDHSNTRKYRGLGIGLTVVNLLVNAIKGEMQVESTEGEGSKINISLSLPFREKEGSQIIAELEDVVVLIVEDNKVNQLLIKSLVQKMGCKTILADNGKEAVALVQQEQIDIILMDCQMPIMDGFEATHIIRHSEETYFNLPIIAVTANTTARDRNHCFEVGMNAFLKKPIEIEPLRNAIATYTIGGKRG